MYFPPSLGELRAVAILPVQDEADTLPLVLQQVRRLPLSEIVVVVNGSKDRSADIARANGCHTIVFTESLGHDVGRSVGAAAVDADIYLFADADIVISAENLMPFVWAVAQGTDVALNDLSRIIGRGHDNVSLAKSFLNHALGRPELGIASLTCVPHALSRKAVDVITPAHLAVPPIAHADAVLSGLVVRAVHGVDVVMTNRLHPIDSPSRSQMLLAKTIVGDHVEALHYVTAKLGPRGGFHDMQRRRDLLPGAPPKKATHPPDSRKT